MRRFAACLAAFFCVTLVDTTLAQQPQPPQQQQEPGRPVSTRITPGRSLANIAIGSPIQRVFARFGRPSVTIETAVDMVHVYNRFGITVFSRSNMVTAVSTTNSLMKLDEDLGVGYRSELVTARFGRAFREGTVEGFPGMIYDARGIGFGIDRQAVAVIIVFGPNGANQVSGLLPGGVPVRPPVTGFPNVAGLKPFSPETNFMSLPGYLRWLVHQASGTWITYAEAKRIVEEQQRGAR
jgi:hypothetical protein